MFWAKDRYKVLYNNKSQTKRGKNEKIIIFNGAVA